MTDFVIGSMLALLLVAAGVIAFSLHSISTRLAIIAEFLGQPTPPAASEGPHAEPATARRDDGFGSKIDQLTQAIWALQSLSDKPVTPPRAFDTALHARDAARRIEILQSLTAYFNHVFYENGPVPDEKRAPALRAKDDVQPLFGPDLSRSIVQLSNDSAIIEGRGSDLLKQDDGSIASKRWDNQHSYWLNIKERMEKRIAADVTHYDHGGSSEVK